MRVAVAGLGGVVDGLHLPALRRLPEVELAGGFDSSPEARARWAENTDTPVWASFDGMLSDARPELTIIATPPDSHAELAVEALAAGCHVLCEKPLAWTVADADRIVEAADRARRGVAVNHHLRTTPAFAAVKRAIGGDETGRLVFAQVWQLTDMPPWRDPRAWASARADRGLIEAGVHAIDLISFLFGESALAVTARLGSGLDGSPEGDAISLLSLEFSGGRMAQLTSSTLCPAGARHLDLRADCELESLRASTGGRALIKIGKKRAQRAGLKLELGLGGSAWAERGLRRRTLARSPRSPERSATRALIARTIDAFDRGADPPCGAREARDVLRVAEAAYESAASGRRIEMAQVRGPSAASSS